MIFLTNEDLYSQTFEQYIDTEDQEDIKALDTLEKQNIALIKSKLSKRYNVSEIFNQSEADRNDLIVKVLTALVTYGYLRRNAARKIPSDYIEEKKWAMQWLNDVKAGDETPDLPPVDNEAHKEVYSGNSTNEDLYL